MLPLYDMLANAQNGQGMEMLARQFNLSQQQAQLAVEALLPAFSQGLKRNASDPYGIGAFMSAMATGQHAKYFEDAQKAFAPQGVAEGNGILGHLFGSKELSRAVASQAAQATGLGQQVLQQMLPVIASMIMGGLFKQSTNQLQAGGFGGGSNPLGDIIEQMMRQGGGMMGSQPQQQAPQPGNPMDNPLGKMLEGMFGGGGAAAPQPGNPMDNPLGKMLEGMFGGGAAASQRRQQAPGEAQNPLGDNPFGKMFEEMMRGGGAQARPEPEPKARPGTNPSGRPKNPYDDLFGNMFETGRQQRDEYQKGVESIFDQFTKGMDRYK
jgi:hypothetical protein